MTATDRPTRKQIEAAFKLAAWWHTDGRRFQTSDQRDEVERILGEHAYQIIATTASDWHRRNTLTPIAAIMRREVADGTIVTVEGDLFFIVEHEDRDGQPWISALIDDRESPPDIEVLLFPMTYAIVNDLIGEGRSVRITGRVKYGAWPYLVATAVDPMKIRTLRGAA